MYWSGDFVTEVISFFVFDSLPCFCLSSFLSRGTYIYHMYILPFVLKWHSMSHCMGHHLKHYHNSGVHDWKLSPLVTMLRRDPRQRRHEWNAPPPPHSPWSNVILRLSISETGSAASLVNHPCQIPVLAQCWPSIGDAVPALSRH